MKKEYFLRNILLYIYFFVTTTMYCQSRGHLAFTAFNGDSDDDFAITALADIPANATIYFTDKSFDSAANGGSGGFNPGEGIITWETGGAIIKSGTIIIFTDIDSPSNTNYGVSIGSISTSGSFNMTTSTGGDTILVYVGSDKDTPTAFITGIKNASLLVNELLGTKLSGSSDLIAGVDFLEFNPSANPDGGYYTGSRSNQSSYDLYLPILTDVSNWISIVNGDGNSLLPFTEECFTNHTTTWNGLSSSSWNLSSNWSNGIPTTDSNVIIPNTATKPSIATPSVAGNIHLASNAPLSNTSNLTTKGMIHLDAGASLISDTALQGKLSYKRTLTSNWHLVANPFQSQNILAFATQNSNSNAIDTNESKYALAPYENNSGTWNYFTTSNIETAGNFISGKGYAVLRNSAGQIRFTGNFPSNTIAIAITEGTTSNWNLIGNPFPSFVPANTSADAINNFITINATKLHPSYQALYFWNGTEYQVINHATESKFIAPGQGFFVYSKSGGATIQFTPQMQNHQTSEVFYKSTNTNPSITVIATNDKTTSTSEIKFFSNATIGLDPGYDAGKFDGFQKKFSIYTRLVSNTIDTPFSIQALPEIDDVTIPLIVSTNETKRIKISLNCKSLPEGLMVFLIDNLSNTVTRLDKIDSYIEKNVSSEDHERFQIKTSFADLSKTLSTKKFTLENLKVFQSGNRIIINEKLKKPLITIADLLGKKLKHKISHTKNQTTINLQSFNQGLYVITIKSNGVVRNKKIFLTHH